MSETGRTILIVEDAVSLAGVQRDYFERDGFVVDHIADGAGAVEHIVETAPDLVILDIMLPGKSGLDICRELRRISDVPVIMTTARVEEIDRLLGLEIGADDYVCKPYSPREVVARTQVVLRRCERSPVTTVSPADRLIHIDEEAWTAAVGDHRLDLTRKEFQLLRILVNRPGRVFSRAELLDLAYADDTDVSDRVIDSHIKNLRKKLADVLPDREPIRSLYGVGYSYEE